MRAHARVPLRRLPVAILIALAAGPSYTVTAHAQMLRTPGSSTAGCARSPASGTPSIRRQVHQVGPPTGGLVGFSTADRRAGPRAAGDRGVRVHHRSRRRRRALYRWRLPGRGRPRPQPRTPIRGRYAVTTGTPTPPRLDRPTRSSSRDPPCSGRGFQRGWWAAPQRHRRVGCQHRAGHGTGTPTSARWNAASRIVALQPRRGTARPCSPVARSDSWQSGSTASSRSTPPRVNRSRGAPPPIGTASFTPAPVGSTLYLGGEFQKIYGTRRERDRRHRPHDGRRSAPFDPNPRRRVPVDDYVTLA